MNTGANLTNVYPLPITVNRIFHRNADQIAVLTPKNEDCIAILKKIGARWSATHRCWYLPYRPDVWKNIKLHFSNIQIAHNSNLSIPHQAAATQHEPDIDLSRTLSEEKTEHNAANSSHAPWYNYKGIVGKYFCLSLAYHKERTAAMNKVKGVYWNKQHRCYFILRKPKPAKEVEQLLDLPSLFPASEYLSDTQAT